jgi:hypothetical protein
VGKERRKVDAHYPGIIGIQIQGKFLPLPPCLRVAAKPILKEKLHERYAFTV